MEEGECSEKLLEVSKLKISLAHDGVRNRHCYLPGPLFGSYSFINISSGKEETDDDQYCSKNILEVAVVVRILQNLYKAWKGLRKQLSIAVASEYRDQVGEIQEKLGEKYKGFDGFSVKVMSFNELQGKEVDIIILSTVKSNSGGSLGFLSNNNQSAHVAVTRARQSLWILGNERALSEGDSVWKSIICDVKNRNCFFNIEEDDELANFAVEVKQELDQLDEISDPDSFLFKNARWKVLLSDDFQKSFRKIKSFQMKKLVINLVLRLANGWRPKRRNVSITCDESEHVLKQYKVKDLYVVCSTDIEQQEYLYIQVLKVWDLLPMVEIPKLVKRLDSTFRTYTDDFINHCKAKRVEGDLEIPMSWETSRDIVRHEKTGDIEEGHSNERRFSQDLKVSESFLLMKFYSISSCMVSHLLSGCNGKELELPFELTRQEMDIIRFDRSSFILGRSGTGKTTVIIRKLFQREQSYHVASEGFHEVDHCTPQFKINEAGEGIEETNDTFLRQIFVSFNPGLCYAVKQHVSGLKRFARGEKFAEDSTSDNSGNMEDISTFEDKIPDSFAGLTSNLYPLVITFRKFLIMLDGTVGNSFFNRFPEARRHSHESTKSMALKTFIRVKEVNFDKFNVSYWPHFRKELTNSFDPLTVFTEIMSHIKGGLQSLNVHDQKLSFEDYLLQTNSRVSNLCEPEREKIYEIFLQYEKKKKMNTEYDLADLVTDLHRRLKENEYEAAKFHFVYIDEVQDLSMAQIALFRNLCRNVEDGFVFSGDTAQTIAKGIDFRFEDIRHLFYEEFVMKSRGDRVYGRRKKGQISEISHLFQNFRTHAGVLKLAQSVIELVHHFFPLSIDFLSPETSPLDGEPPVLLESGHGKTEFSSMLSKMGDSGRNLVGFGADQVVLVRDDNIKNEISKYDWGHALILTISECKGLEFKDVLLYNFLSSSPIKDQWKLVYTFMKDNDIIGCKSPLHSPSFDLSKHRLLCSELKQLYVAITRTRQRLWILETGDGDGFSTPMHDYWKRLQLVQVRELDNSFLEEIQVSSSEEEWKSRGVKFFNGQKYESAKTCFERAGDTFLARWAEASCLRAAASNISTSNSDIAGMYLKNAGQIFNSIRKYEAAAECFYEAKEYKMAGSIYLENLGDSKLQEAGECFTRARSYEHAAFAYAKGNFFSKCLNSCLKGKLYSKGLHYIPYWKDHATVNNCMTRDKDKIESVEQKLLEGAAQDYKKLGDKSAMMKYVKAFNTRNLMRDFLKTEGCLDELIQLESEWGNFVDAAEIATGIGETLLAVELLAKGKHYKEASLLILSYVLGNSLWVQESKGWPLKQFRGKKELLDKATMLADNVSNGFLELVCMEKNVLSDEKIALSELQRLSRDSKRYGSVGGEILSSWKILDVHLAASSSVYVWRFHVENGLLQNQVSVETLVFFWNVWKEKIGKIFEYLGNLESDDVYGEFCLNYLGVRAINDSENNKTIYSLLKADAFWVKHISNHDLHRKERLVSCKPKQFAHAARCYWSSTMISVGTQVLKKLRALYEFSKVISLPLHCQTFSLVHTYDVAKSLIESKFLLHKDHDKALHDCLDLCVDDFLANILHMDWKNPLTLQMTGGLTETKKLKSLVEHVIFKIVSSNDHLTYGEMEKVVLAIVGGPVRLSGETYRKVSLRFGSNPFWRSCIESFGKLRSNFMDVSAVKSFYKDLQLAYYADCLGRPDYISPNCFTYLVECLLTNIFFLKGCFFSAKSCFIEWIISQERNKKSTLELEADWQEQFSQALDIIASIVAELLYNEHDVITWMKSSKLRLEFHTLLVLRLFVALCSLCVNSGKHYDLLSELLDRAEIASKLPPEFYDIIRKMEPGNLNHNVCVLAKAFRRIGNPLVVASSGKRCIEYDIPDAIFIDLGSRQRKREVDSLLFR